MTRFEGWKITGLMSAIIASILVAILAWHGPTEDGVRAVLRGSARSSVVLFLLAFSASSLHDLLRKNWTAWLLRNRRYLGVSFAVSHFYHLLALVALAVWFPHPFLNKLNWITLVGGGLTYLFIFAMAATSFDYTRQWLGTKRWQILHTTGSYYIWILFTQSYFPRAAKEEFDAPFLAALVIGMFLRMLRIFRKRRKPIGIVSTEDA